MKRKLLLVFALCLGFVFVGCGNKKAIADYSKYEEASDYSKSEHWLALPDSTDYEVDVFYLYPTVWRKVNPEEANICEIDNSSMIKGAKIAFNQATVFETVGNIYAPYYRQADVEYGLTLSIEEQNQMLGGIPRLDAFAAFDYYIKNYNEGRPFILAGHSQGSNVMLYLLSDYMKENPDVQNRMIAAYVIGYSVTENYLSENPHLKFAEGPDDTGVIISYNTEAPEVDGNNPVLLPGAIAINPISWTRDEKLATSDESLGSMFWNNKGEMVPKPHYADARVDQSRGVVICSTADIEALSPGNEIFGKGVYHRFDYPFYYFDLRENASHRIKEFLNKKKVVSD